MMSILLGLNTGWVTVGLVGLAVALGAWALADLGSYTLRRRLLDRRLIGWGAEERLRLAVRRSVLLKLGDWIDGSPRFRKLERQLIQADLRMRPSEYLAILLLVGLAFFSATQIFFGLNPLVGAGAAYGGARLISRSYLGTRRDHYISSFDGQMPEAAILISHSLKAGLSVVQAFQVVAEKMPPPAGTEFARISREIRLGVDLERALKEMLGRLPSEELRMMITTILIQRRAGGNLAEALAVMSNAVVARRRLKQEIRTLTTEARFTGIILIALPLFTLLVINQLLPGSVARFLNNPLGWLVVGVFVGVQVLAFVLVQRIMAIKV